MTTKEDIYNYIEWHKNKYNCGDEPIFEIRLFEKAVSGGFNYPDTGIEDRPGFYYELDTAIHAMNQNWADIQDHAFHAGFILCHFPAGNGYESFQILLTYSALSLCLLHRSYERRI